MDKKYLVINSGSASHKHALYQDGKCIYFLHFEMIGESFIAHETVGETKRDLPITEKIFNKSVQYTVERLLANRIIKDKSDVSAVGIRIVAPGIYFQENRPIDRLYKKTLKQNKDKSPLHITSVLQELKFVKKILPKAPIIGVSDSVFHKSIPDVSKYYALPIYVSRKYGIYKYGYHGLSVQSVVARLASKFGTLPGKVVVCHLGGGASVTAVLNGQSIDTSMGFTPLDGLVMATRVGSIDPGAVLYLAEKLKKSQHQMVDFFNHECGLFGLSNGRSDDIRELLKFEKEGDLNAKLALDVYATRVKKLIAQATAMLGGIDTLVFAGTVGERSFPIRERICSGLDFFGIKLNHAVNNETDAVENELSFPGEHVKIVVIKTDEMGEIAKETERVSKVL
jgi:acetate kinase